jgi:hypothetical protein
MVHGLDKQSGEVLDENDPDDYDDDDDDSNDD